MANQNHKPVIFLAFANDRDDGVKYLRNLPQEFRQVRAALEKAKSAGLCEVVERANATVKDILDVFQNPEYRNRIAIFHYGGHANGYQLLLESPEGKTQLAYAGGLAAFLGQQHGLQLVFLNGCLTQQQVQGLLQANVPAVIATSQDIDDAVATAFATQFYQGLAAGDGIRVAYNKAAATIQMEKGDNLRHLYSIASPREDRWPWELYLKEGAESVAQWNLPAAVDDPTFGLPPILIGDLPEEPFRHLHWFEREQAEVFFGRNHQIRELYERVTAPQTAPIILLYGQSGVGKSSLLAAGLMPRLEGTYEIYYRRREQKIGLLGTLKEILFSIVEEPSVAEAWLALERRHNKPLLVILDQVEEIYTRPNQEQSNEWRGFLEALQETFADPTHRPRGKLIFGFRKEWLAEIDKQLSENRLNRSLVFLASLDRRGIIEAIAGPSRAKRLQEHYSLTIEEGLPEIIADDLLEDRDSPIAPTLQILLTKMWDEAKKQNFSQPRFDRDLYQTLKKQGILLKDFLDQQLEALKQWRPEVVDSGLALDVLAFHTTSLGTAEQRTAEHLEQEYNHQKNVLPLLIQNCKDLYLLVDPAQNKKEKTSMVATRLAHDTIAPLIRERFDDSDKPGQRARRILENRAVEWRDGRQSTPLDEQDLAVAEQGASGMRAHTRDEQRLIEASRKKRIQKQHQRRMLQSAGVVAILLIILAAGVALIKWKEAERQTRIVTSRYLASQAQAALEKFPQRSLLLAIAALNITREKGEPRVPIAEEVLRQALANTGGRGLSGHEGAINAVAISHDNHWLITASEDNTARLWDLTAEDPAATSIVLRGHEGAVNAVAFSFDNRWLVTGSEDHTARLWDLTTKAPIVLRGHKGAINDIAISSDSHWLVTGSSDGTARLWDLFDEHLDTAKHVLRDHQGYIYAIAISPDNHWLVTGSEDNTARLWNLKAANPALTSIVLRGHERAIKSVAFSSNYRWLVTGSEDNTARLWKLTNPNPAAESIVLRGHLDHITAVAISPNNRWVVTASRDSTAHLWDLTAESLNTAKFVLHGHENDVTAVAFTPDNKWLVTGSEDHTARLWDLTVKDMAAASIILRGHDASIAAAAISSDNHFLVTGSDDNTARMWDLTTKDWTATPGVLHSHDKPITAVTISPDNHWLVTGSEDHTVRLWDLIVNDSATAPIVLRGHESAVKAIAISPNNRWLVTAGSEENTARLWNLAALKPAATPIDLQGHKDWITAVAISSDNHWLVTGSADHTARLWNLDAQNPTDSSIILRGHTDWITAIAISSDNQWLVTGSNDHTTRLWDLTAQKPDTAKFVLRGHEDDITSVAISPNNRWLVTGSNDSTACLWNLRAKDPATTSIVLRGHRGPIYAIAISPNNQWVATGSIDHIARLWNLTASNPAADSIALRGHHGSIYAVAFTPDNKLLVTGSADDTARLWDLTATNPATAFVVLRGHEDNITTVAISSDSRWLVTGSKDHTVRLWSLRLEELMDLACRTAGHNLTRKEWQEYMPDEPYRATCPNLPVSVPTTARQ